MKSIPTTCKFCHQPITTQISEDYVGDPHKILPLSACNRCADMRVEKRQIESRIKFTCMMRAFGPKFHADGQESKTHTTLTTHARAYCELLARWHNLDEMWDPEIVRNLMDTPAGWPAHLGHVWTMFESAARRKPNL